MHVFCTTEHIEGALTRTHHAQLTAEFNIFRIRQLFTSINFLNFIMCISDERAKQTEQTVVSLFRFSLLFAKYEGFSEQLNFELAP